MGAEYSEKMQGYIEALEEEKSKILVFQRELPLCLELVTQAIEACKHQLSGTITAEYNVNGQSECSEQTSTEGTPVLEEFIPLKRTSRSSDDGEDEDEEHERHSHKQLKVSCSKDKVVSDSKKKSDWLRSAQLWNQTPDPTLKEDYHPPKKVSVVEVTRNGGAFQPFHREKAVGKSSQSPLDKPQSPVPTAATSSTAEPATASGHSSGSGKREEKEGQTQRKQRRCWSPELHRRFLQALQQLGGSHAATPKQIRDLMKVDGLTNDEVKSHLQKFRLHTRRPSPTIHSSNTSQAPQIVVVGGIWVPPPEYAGAAATESARPTTANGIYAPIATAPEPCLVQKSQHNENSQSEGRSSHSTGGGVQSQSPSTSSSSHTTTASPVY